MTISLTYQEYWELFQEVDKKELQLDVLDEKDITLKHIGRPIQGLARKIQLREGILLWIEETQYQERLLLNYPEFKLGLRFHFVLSGKMQRIYSSAHKETSFFLNGGRHMLWGSGLHNHQIEDFANAESLLEVTLCIQPEVLHSFVSDSSGELPQVFHHLVEPFDRQCYRRGGETPTMVNTLLQQIIQCPYQGLTKRMYLEGKITEIIALMLEEEAAVQQGEFKTCLLQPDQLERIQYAKEILLQNLSNPPSLMELARQVGMCDYNLKRGFKEVFGTTVFGYLRDRRLEKAQQLLLEQNMTVASVARAGG